MPREPKPSFGRNEYRFVEEPVGPNQQKRATRMNRNQFLRLLSYVRHYWYLLPFVLVSMIAATLLDLVAPWITG